MKNGEDIYYQYLFVSADPSVLTQSIHLAPGHKSIWQFFTGKCHNKRSSSPCLIQSNKTLIIKVRELHITFLDIMSCLAFLMLRTNVTKASQFSFSWKWPLNISAVKNPLSLGRCFNYVSHFSHSHYSKQIFSVTVSPAPRGSWFSKQIMPVAAS